MGDHWSDASGETNSLGVTGAVYRARDTSGAPLHSVCQGVDQNSSKVLALVCCTRPSTRCESNSANQGPGALYLSLYQNIRKFPMSRIPLARRIAPLSSPRC
ncbi:hypothetical protein HAX54_017819 [Datura stramonium]|uniref:Uncharacterized protein n=1 Tax=Datura stramonium TaxID=4076 RepID=A0ABS8UM08_DATST|nr:hypothetical protein [Datura stramonium]